MDFGEILKLWESSERPTTAKQRTTARTGRTSASGSRAADAQEAWLRRHGVPEDIHGGRDEPLEPRLSRADIEAMPIDALLDLHGMTKTEAEAALAAFFRRVESEGCRKVLIVHGKGVHSAAEPVLGALVRAWLERRPSAGRTGHANAANGGRGATWVLLKQPGTQRSR